MRPRCWRLLAVLAAAAVVAPGAGCGVGRSACTDGQDNDGDGRIDEADPGCAWSDGVGETPDPPPAACANGSDDDGDGKADFPSDPGCMDGLDDDETDPPPECNDGIDQNGNGVADYPHDPGCESLTDLDEDDGPPTRACADGLDNDDDGAADYPLDTGCTSAADDDERTLGDGACGPGIDVQPLPPAGVATGDRATAAPSGLISPACGGAGAEYVWTVAVTAASALLVTTDFPETTLDTVVYLRGDCRMADTELGCDDDAAPGRASTLVVPRVEPGTYYVVVDAATAVSFGHFKLSVEPRVALHDPCDPMATSACAPGLVCRRLTPAAPGPTCEPHECEDALDNDGDGTIDYPFEAGCTAPTDDSELIAAGDPIPDCGDGVDDDGDGRIDYPADPGCDAASDLSELEGCAPGVPVLPLPAAGATGTTAGGSSMFTGSCDSFDTGFAPERVHGFRTTTPLLRLRFSTAGSTYPTALYVHAGDCAAGAEVACAANTSGAPGVEAVVEAPAPDTSYFVFVDGGDAFAPAGGYTLRVSGELAGGAACTPGDPQFVCAAGWTCPAGTCAPTPCNDGVDNDGDGRADAADPGCASAADGDEAPDPAPLPECADGVDNDGDALTDYPADPGCARASDAGEADCTAETDPIADASHLATSTGTTLGKADDFAPSCSAGSTAGDAVHRFTVPGRLSQLTVDTIGSTLDSVLSLKATGCAAADLACNDDVSATVYQSRITVTDLAAGTWFLVVDGYGADEGPYTLHIAGTVAAGEPCDPLQVTAGFLACASGTCRDLGGGNRCQ